MQGFLDTRYHFTQGIGYEKGYTTLDLFALQELRYSLFGLANARAHFLNQGETAFNGGLGLRYAPNTNQRYIFGANLFYDYRKVSQKGINQVSFGLEALADQFDVRFELCSALNKQLFFLGSPTFCRFSGHQGVLTQEVETPLSFCMAEVAYRFSLTKFQWCFPKLCGVSAISPYYLFKSEQKGVHFGGAPGVKGRIKLCFSDLFYAEAIFTHDKIYKTLAQGVVGISFPFGKRSHSCPIDCRLLRSIEKQEIIPVQKKNYETKFINKKTNKPYRFLFVDEDLFGTGKGTFESPYTRLKLASLKSREDDIFFVRPTERGLLEEVTLKKGQKLWTRTAENSLEGVNIPSSSPLYRQLATIQTFITLTEDNEISGFYFGGTGVETGIYSDNLKGNHLIRNCIFEKLKRGIDLKVQSKAHITLINNVFDDISEECLLLSNCGKEVSLIAKNNSFSNASFGMSFNLGGKTTLYLSSNEMKEISDNGILLNQYDSDLKAEINKNRIEANGMAVSLNCREANIKIEDNILTSLTERVLDINTLGGSLSILNNRFFGILGFEVLSIRRLGDMPLLLDVYQNHFLSTDFTNKFYLPDNSSIISNWGSESLLKVKVVDKLKGQKSLNEQNFGNVTAENVEFISK